MATGVTVGSLKGVELPRRFELGALSVDGAATEVL